MVRIQLEARDQGIDPALQRGGTEQFQAACREQSQRPFHRLDHGNDMQAWVRMRVGVVVLLGHASVAVLASGHDASEM